MKKKKFQPGLQIRTSEEKPALNRSYSLSKSGVFQSDKGFAISKTGIQESPANAKPRRELLVRSFDELQMMEMLGHGAGGVVNKACHRPTGIHVAVKSIDVLDNDKRHQLMRELKTLYNCTNEHIVSFYGAFYDDCHVFVVLEYMDAGSLADMLRKAGSFPESVVSDFARQMVQGMLYLHKERYQVHRDMKPANMLCARTGRVQLSDFGVAAELSDTLGHCSTFLGTARYMAPETLSGNTYSFPSDVWALGICIVEFATGEYPYTTFKSHWDLLEAMQHNPPPRLPEAAEDGTPFTAHGVSFVELCLQLDPAERADIQTLADHPFVNFPSTMNQINRQHTVAWIAEQMDRYSTSKPDVQSAEMEAGQGAMELSGSGLVVSSGADHVLDNDEYGEESFEDYQPSPTSPGARNLSDSSSDAMADFEPVLKNARKKRPPGLKSSDKLDALMQSKEGREAVRDSLSELSFGPSLFDMECAQHAAGGPPLDAEQVAGGQPPNAADHPLNAMRDMMLDGQDELVEDEFGGRIRESVAGDLAPPSPRPALIMMSPAPKKNREIRPTSRPGSQGSAGPHSRMSWTSSVNGSQLDPEELAASVAYAVNAENDGAMSARGQTPPMLSAGLAGGLGGTSRPTSAGSMSLSATPKRVASMARKSRTPKSSMMTPRSPLYQQTVELTEKLHTLNKDEQQVLLQHVLSKLGQSSHPHA